MWKYEKFLFSILISFLFCSCDRSLSETDLHGKWSNISLELEIRSYNNTAYDSLLIVNESNWLKVLKIKPIVTTFKKDGTYLSEYFNSYDVKIHEINGSWTLNNDTLYLDQKEPVKNISAYYTELKRGKLSFRAIIDWDGDKQKDDLYYGVQKRIY